MRVNGKLITLKETNNLPMKTIAILFFLISFYYAIPQGYITRIDNHLSDLDSAITQNFENLYYSYEYFVTATIWGTNVAGSIPVESGVLKFNSEDSIFFFNVLSIADESNQSYYVFIPGGEIQRILNDIGVLVYRSSEEIKYDRFYSNQKKYPYGLSIGYAKDEKLQWFIIFNDGINSQTVLFDKPNQIDASLRNVIAVINTFG